MAAGATNLSRNPRRAAPAVWFALPMIRSVKFDFSAHVASIPAALANKLRERDPTASEEAEADAHIARAREQLREQYLARKRGQSPAAIAADDNDDL